MTLDRIDSIKLGEKPRILVGLDLSGSICYDNDYRKIFRHYMLQIAGMLDYRDFELRVVQWTRKVGLVCQYTPKNVFEIPDSVDHIYTSRGNFGGSNMSCVYDYNIESGFNADIIINITDGFIDVPPHQLLTPQENYIIIAQLYASDIPKNTIELFTKTKQFVVLTASIEE